MDQDHIDDLLERYLSLLDEYTRLRTRLSTVQSGVFHNIARANFTGERGLRYGSNQYDDRMQASRLLNIALRNGNNEVEVGRDGGGEDEGGRGLVEFTVAPKASDRTHGTTKTGNGSGENEDNAASVGGDENKSQTDADGIRQPRKEESKKTASKSGDPLRWFGLLTPMPLRDAQSQSIEAVEQVIPRIATVSAEMLHLEIEVRRARKKRSKAEAAERKENQARNEMDMAGGDNATAAATTRAVRAS